VAIRLGAALARVGGWRRERSGRRHPDSGGWSGVEALFEPSECRLSCVFGLGFDVFDDGGDQGCFGEFFGRDVFGFDEDFQGLGWGAGQDVGAGR
jgi:hypothetical protein